MADYDSPWKEALDVYFPAFLLLFFPAIYRDIDWSKGYESLDKELQQIAPQSAQGRRYVDRLFKVWRSNGRQAWVLIHIEVQAQRERAFPRRLYVYNYRIDARYNRKVVSLAVLADDDPSWRPDTYRQSLWGWSLRMQFPVVKLLDYADREAELEADKNPFAKVVLAHLKALETRRDPVSRRLWKFRLVRGLYERGFSAEDVRQLFRLIDWLMELPPPLDDQFWDEVQTFQKERHMPFVSTPERYGIKKGLLQAIEGSLRVKFGDGGAELVPQIAALNDADKFDKINRVIAGATDVDEVRQAVRQAAAPPTPRKKRTRDRRNSS